MRVAVWHNLPSGGGFRALYDQITGLVSRGHAVEVWCPETAERALLPIDAVATKVHRLPLVAKDHVVYRHRSFRKALHRLKSVREALQALENHVARCAQEMADGAFDVVLGHSSTLFYMHPLARFTRIPSVIYLQEVYRILHEARPALPWEALPDPDRRLGSLRYWRHFATDLVDVQTDRIVLREERRAAREWDTILCNSFFSRESILRAYAVDARVCYLGVDTSSFAPSARQPMNYLVGVGGLYAAKGAHLIIAALAALPPATRPSLKWIGNFADPTYRQACETLARMHGVDFSCEVRVAEETLLERLQLALALVYPSILEPFGYGPLEANACGVPVLGIAEGGVRETVIDGVNGLLVANRQPASWSAAIQKLMETPGLRNRLGTRGVDQVHEQWAAPAAIARLEQELEIVARNGRRKEPAPSIMDVSG